ncbi:hypothetical protein C9994_11970 [Marivirga lumbricoides]|uniref:Alpha-L-arabinofuranosidase C-terminal domain-containing protein n=1 Tax=Marivirga lumbricoides TaxID=1046115 RepID=A0A2T4DLF8_9BACT|nr:hypothetical protein C9994_11970 [Marivirga lumbricoides]
MHQDATLLPLEVMGGSTYEMNGKKLPAISASASKNKAGVIHASLVNIHASESKEIEIVLRGTENSKVSGTILKSAKLQDFNSFENPDKIKTEDFKGFKRKGDKITVTLPPFSVVVLKIEK